MSTVFADAAASGLSIGEVVAIAGGIVVALGGAVVKVWTADRANLVATNAERGEALKAAAAEREKLLAENDRLTDRIELLVAERERATAKLERYEPPAGARPSPSLLPPMPAPPPSRRNPGDIP